MSIIVILGEAPLWNLSKDETAGLTAYRIVVLTKCYQIFLPSLVKELLCPATLSEQRKGTSMSGSKAENVHLAFLNPE